MARAELYAGDFFMFSPQGLYSDASVLRRALISLSDKSYLHELASFLSQQNCEIFATSSTLIELKKIGVPATGIDELTQFPEILGGRVKTLHPAVFGPILARGDVLEDAQELAKYNLLPFDLVVCNLYPFQEMASKSVDLASLIEKIDIGGVTLLRAAAKNCARVSVLCDPRDYKSFIKNVLKNEGKVGAKMRVSLALKAIRETAAYDTVISDTLNSLVGSWADSDIEINGPIKQRANSANNDEFGAVKNLSLAKIQDLRYGENPHQNAAFYSCNDSTNRNEIGGFCNLTDLKCLNGKELSYNNVLDIEHAVRLVNEFKTTAAVIVKHNVPCGVAIRNNSNENIAAIYQRAFDADPVSPFGGIVCFNEKIDEQVAQKLYETFLEVIVAPDFDAVALECLQRKKNLRLVKLNTSLPLANKLQITPVQGGFLCQSVDNALLKSEDFKVVTQAQADEPTISDMNFAFTVVKHVRSNAIVLARNVQVLAIAGGFTNRVDAVEHCLKKARISLEGAVLASDAFFPFPDSIDLLKGSGIKAIIQPVGSVQDSAVIAAANAQNLCMALTGMRHFKH